MTYSIDAVRRVWNWDAISVVFTMSAFNSNGCVFKSLKIE